MIGVVLILVGLILWLASSLPVIGIVLIVVGIVLLFAPGPWYGYHYYRGRRGPP